ncbi:hypothetical protein CEK28_08535 [Xenophilus sp. AP218F]|nr:hypothetical protein CEK28_08535 [Xenophilus sp. AP218F]
MAALFGELGAIFGAGAMGAKYGEDPAETRRQWALGLMGFSDAEIERGVQACRVRGGDWPPTLPVFRGMCRPYRQLFEHGMQQMARQDLPMLPHEQAPRWATPAQYWALRSIWTRACAASNYDAIAALWQHAYDQQCARRDLPPVPPPQRYLPPAGKASSGEAARQALSTVREILNKSNKFGYS